MRRLWVVALLVAAAAACGDDGDEGGDTSAEAASPEATFTLTSSAFDDGGTIPADFTCDGVDVSPPLDWSDVPAETVELALVVDDPDAPGTTFVHWVVWGLDPEAPGLPEGEVPDGASEGTTDLGEATWAGPCPPEGDDPHRYMFSLLALSEPLDLEAGATAAEAREAAADSLVAEAQLTGSYGRSTS